MDSLDDQKKKLEIQKLKSELNTEKYLPSRVFLFWQTFLPGLLTLLSVVGTIYILFKTNVFDANNKYLEASTIQLKNLRDSVSQATTDFDSKKSKQKVEIDSLKGESKRLRNKIHIDSIVLNDKVGKMNNFQRQNADLRNDTVAKSAKIKQLQDHVSYLRSNISTYHKGFQPAIDNLRDIIRKRQPSADKNQQMLEILTKLSDTENGMGGAEEQAGYGRPNYF